jgi:lactate dehydrogenase-like 2-hydroxyacid dehydrogenase
VHASGLDVYEEESKHFFHDLSDEVIEDDVLTRLTTFPTVIVTPHQGTWVCVRVCVCVVTLLPSSTLAFRVPLEAPSA